VTGGAPLKIGIVDQSPVPTGGTGAEAVRNTLELAGLAERLGYSRYWLAEHHSTNSFAGSAPEVLIPMVAAVTTTLRVGSGGVLLPHYSPFKVAEQFRVMEALFPGRVDLGIGRAPGGDARAVMALGYGRSISIEHFPQQVAELIGWLENSYDKRHPWGRVRAMPRGDTIPQLWLLGSGGGSAGYAAQMGLSFTFAQFISGEDGAPTLRAYRERFLPAANLPAPRASLAVGVICADTDDEARRLSSSLELWRRRIAIGRDRGIPSPDEALRELGESWRLPDLGTDGARAVVGAPAHVAAELRRLAARSGVDEVLAVTVTHDHAARLRSHELLAQALELTPA
jgi:luciferase family oxidoreductase group 1